MQNHRFLVSAIVVLTGFCLSSVKALAQSVTPSNAAVKNIGKSKIFLKGSIEHSAKVEPLGNSFQAGSIFDTSTLKQMTPNNVWYQIPQWMGGEWKHTHTTTYFRQDLLSGKERFDTSTHAFSIGSTGGVQRDAKGNIWETAGTGYTNVGKSEGYTIVQLIRTADPVEVTSAKVTLRFFGTMIQVDGATNKIQCSSQIESINTYTKAGDGIIKVNSSNKVFSDEGIALRMYKNLSYETRLSPFQPTNVDHSGKNYRRLFLEYLDSHGLSSLKPAG